MIYYEEVQKKLAVPESAVDCDRCVSPFKCCTYRPFIANFLAGKIFSDSNIPDEILSDWDLLIVGLAPSISYRKNFAKKGRWGFGSEESLLCAFYEKKNGRCKIWSSRPSVCRTFFCKSSYGDQGMSYWKKAEEFSWRMEWVMLEDFLFEEGWTLDDIEILKNYLREDQLSHLHRLPAEYRFSTVAEARAFYGRAYEHVARKNPTYIHEILGKEGVRLYGDLVAEQANIR